MPYTLYPTPVFCTRGDKCTGCTFCVLQALNSIVQCITTPTDCMAQNPVATPNPKPSILNPIPYTLYPTSETQNPKQRCAVHDDTHRLNGAKSWCDACMMYLLASTPRARSASRTLLRSALCSIRFLCLAGSTPRSSMPSFQYLVYRIGDFGLKVWGVGFISVRLPGPGAPFTVMDQGLGIKG